MPDLDGLETLRAIRQAHPTAQVIMLSGRQTPATIMEAVRLGAADYVLKPGDPEGSAKPRSKPRSATRSSASRSAPKWRGSARRWPRIPRARSRAGARPAMQPVVEMVDRIADSDVDVLTARGKRRRQGSDRARAPSPLGPSHEAVRQGELRGLALRSARERAVRPRAGRVHRRRRPPASASSSSRSTAP